MTDTGTGASRPDRSLQPLGDPDEVGDFAEEHDDTTLADQVEGGPEHAPEDVSPRGRGGEGGMDVGRHG